MLQFALEFVARLTREVAHEERVMSSQQLLGFPEMEGDSNLAHDWRAIGFGDEDGARHEGEIFE